MFIKLAQKQIFNNIMIFFYFKINNHCSYLSKFPTKYCMQKKKKPSNVTKFLKYCNQYQRNFKSIKFNV